MKSEFEGGFNLFVQINLKPNHKNGHEKGSRVIVSYVFYFVGGHSGLCKDVLLISTTRRHKE